MNAGGAETFLMKIYRAIDRNEYQMDFCVNVKEKNFYEDEILSLGGRMYRIPAKSENMKEYKRQLSELVKREGYEYVLRITSNCMGFLDLKIAKKAGARVCSARSSNASDGGGIKPFVAHRIGRLLYGRYVDVKIAPSDLAARYTFGDKAYENGRVNILHNAVDLNVFYFDGEARTRIRRELNIADDVKVIGHVGRFFAQKNHSFLVDVFSKIHKADKNTVLVLVGKGDLEDSVREQVHSLGLDDAVIFTGVRSDVPKLLSAFDAFVFPSFYEGMPNTVIEAQATGLPCIISDTITREADITGLVEYLPLGDAEYWAQKSIAALNKERVDTKKDFIENRYDVESVAVDFARTVMPD